MGLVRSCFDELGDRLRNASVLSLGYPDVHLTADEVRARYGCEVPVHPDTGMPESVALFAALGSRLRTVDRRVIRGPEDVVDLNLPVVLGEYDLVLDAGTIEHCFHAGQALLNAAAAVKPFGWIYHTPPLAMLNHGFYNLCPTLFHDFYTQNGWEIALMKGYEAKGFGRAFDIAPAERAPSPPSESVVHVLARRMPQSTFAIPEQSKYMQRAAA